MLQFSCDGCGTRFNVPEKYAGRRGRCKVCSAYVEAPKVETPAPAMATLQPWQPRPVRAGVGGPQSMPGRPQPAQQPVRQPAMPERTKRLIWDAQLIEQTLQSLNHIRIKSTDGEPAERYEIEYRVRGLARDASDQLVVMETHCVEIQLPANYPDGAPQCRMLTPIFHPNINKSQIGATDLWTREDRLVDVIVQIGRMIGYQSYKLRTPLDAEAAMWAEANAEHLPVEDRELTAGGMAIPGAEVASVPGVAG